MEYALLIETIAPWLGGGATAALAAFTLWLWLGYFRRDKDQRDFDKEQRDQYEKIEKEQRERHDKILEDTQKDRNYWREMAINRQKNLVLLEEQNAELHKQNKLLEAQIEILREEKARLIEFIESMEARP